MLRVRDVCVDIPATMGTEYIVTGLRERYKYAAGTKTNEVIGAYVDIVLPERDYRRVSVNVPSAGVHLTDADITDNVRVRFDGLQVAIYVIEGHVRVSVRADSVAPMKKATA